MGSSCTAFTIQQVPGKGLGGFAKRDYVRGECILAEEPLMSWRLEAGEGVTEKGVEACVAALDSRDRQDFWALCQNAQYGAVKRAHGIWLSNAYPTDGTNAGTGSTPHKD